MTRRAAIVSPLRTPVGKFLGGLSSLNAGQLGAVILKALMERNKNVDWQAVGYSFLGALVLNMVIAINHRRDRYIV